MIHKIRKPFMCREDQFGHGRELVIGIAVKALETHNPYRFKIGKNPRMYIGDSVEALRVATIWKNVNGKDVAIVPVRMFKRIDDD